MATQACAEYHPLVKALLSVHASMHAHAHTHTHTHTHTRARAREHAKSAHQHVTPRRDYCRVSPRLIILWVGRPCWRCGSHKSLLVHCPSAQQKCPVSRTSGCVERPREHQDVAPSSPHQGGKLWESEIVADGNANPPVRRVERGVTFACCEGVGFSERDLARDIDVKQVNLCAGVCVSVGGGKQSE